MPWNKLLLSPNIVAELLRAKRSHLDELCLEAAMLRSMCSFQSVPVNNGVMFPKQVHKLGSSCGSRVGSGSGLGSGSRSGSASQTPPPGHQRGAGKKGIYLWHGASRPV